MRHWIIENKRLFNIANNAGLRKIIEGLDPRIMVPALWSDLHEQCF